MNSSNSYTTSQLSLLAVSVYFFTVTKSVLCFIGILLNLSLIYVTVRAKWLHGICNILLVLYDASLIPFMAGVLFYLIEIGTGVTSMQIYDCFRIQILPLFMFCASFPLMLCIATDRFIGVVFPMKYKSLNKWTAVGVALALSSTYSSFYIFAAYQNAKQHHIPIACTTTAALGTVVNTIAKTNFALELVAILMYISIWLHMNNLDKKLRKENRTNNVTIRRLFKSLFTILLVDFVGWSTNSLSITILDLIGITTSSLKSDQLLYYFITSSLNYLAYISSSSNAILLYSFSQEYQRAFDEFLPRWIIALKNAICCKPNNIITAQNIIMVGPNPCNANQN